MAIKEALDNVTEALTVVRKLRDEKPTLRNRSMNDTFSNLSKMLTSAKLEVLEVQQALREKDFEIEKLRRQL